VRGGPATGSTAVPKARGARGARRRRQTPQRRHTVPAMNCRGCAPCACGRCSRQWWHCWASAGSRRIRQAEHAPGKWSVSVQHAACGCVLRQQRHALVGCRCALAGKFPALLVPRFTAECGLAHKACSSVLCYAAHAKFAATCLALVRLTYLDGQARQGCAKAPVGCPL